ncbi:MAG: polyphosphate kinase 1 [Verrucomicrobiaceae bacterium]|nr:polyphosphate kinase 1 [Verrucomicrobiaceae bacterium]
MKSSSPKRNPVVKRPPPINEAAFLNRELSWLAFNERVLDEAARHTLPALERAKFLAITASNLDEFFMVRVGGLQLLKEQGIRTKDDSGLTPTEQLKRIEDRVRSFIERQYAILNGELIPALQTSGIKRVRPSELTPLQRTALQEYFLEQLYPVISPIAIDLEHLPAIPALQLAVLCHVESMDGDKKTGREVLFSIPPVFERRIPVPDTESGTYHYINIEDLLEHFLHHYFPADEISGVLRFRLSRNTDIALADEGAFDLASEMEELLEARTTSPAIRLEIETGGDKNLANSLKKLTGGKAQMYLIPGELDLRNYMSLAFISGFDDLKVSAWPPQPSSAIEPGESIFTAIRRKDLLLHHPFESFDPVLQLVQEAATDPDVVAIKQILYRTAKNSEIISSLIQAANSGKQVTVLVELKARFDEARNLERAEELLQAGAQITYGVRGLKTHAKILMVMRREGGRMMRYCHFGTGNYNESTARLYTDVSYLTCRPDYGADASAFFHTVTGRSRFQHFDKLTMAPFGIRERLISLIEGEIDRAIKGETAEIMLKMNALEDRKMIEALYRASQAGVKIRINVRGICCLRPGVEGLSDNIKVISIIDRYLEHARVFYFRRGGSPAVLIASADFMRRNLSKRVELLTPIEDSAARKRLIQILETTFSDNAQAKELKADGTYEAVSLDGRGVRSQEVFAKEASKRARATSSTPDVLVPHLPKVGENT